ncbi:MAG: single-stranded DNA-binding protein [Succinivibrionaceae bacterium]|nr:single-stranded DNA-binding protein [Succinivibrionaceae bacterium]
MLSVNEVTLCGYVMPPSIKSKASQYGGRILSFDLMTVENWHLKDGQTRQHQEYHHVVLRDTGNYRMCSSYGPLVTPEARLLIKGRLRHKVLVSPDKVRQHYTDIDADTVELLSGSMPHTENGGGAMMAPPQAAPEQMEA